MSVPTCGGHLCHAHRCADADEKHIYTLEHLRGIDMSAHTQPHTTSSKKRNRDKHDNDDTNDQEEEYDHVTHHQEKKQQHEDAAVAPCSIFPPCPAHCPYPVMCRGCTTHCPTFPGQPAPPRPNPQPIPVPNPPPSLPNPQPGGGGNPFPGFPQPTAPTPNQTPVQVTLPSAYLGNLTFDAIDRGNGFWELTALVSQGGRTLILKVIDAQRVGFNQDRLPLLSAVAAMPPMVLHKPTLDQTATVLAGLKGTTRTTRTPAQEQQFKQALITLSPVDAHFLMQHYVRFLYELTGLTSVNEDNVNFLASIVNVPNLDNAYFAQYMVFGNGADQFYVFTSVDCMGHEISHGFIRKTCGLVYQGHSGCLCYVFCILKNFLIGALNEAGADTLGTLFERWLFLKFNNNLNGKSWNQTIGEENYKSGPYIRNMQDPNSSPIPQPAFYRGKFWGDPNNTPMDFGFVHGPEEKEW